MRVLVTGGRDYKDRTRLDEVLNALDTKFGPLIVIHGAARGADTLAGQWATAHERPVLAFPAAWDRDGIAAGPIRNRQMLDQGQPDLVVAFPGGAGTANMVVQAKAFGVTIVEVEG